MASLSPDGEQTIYRVTQEAIQNIVDHSHLEIFPSVRKATVRPHLSSKNTGIDFDTRSKLPIGLWLVGMPKRAERELDALRLLPGVSTTAGSPINYICPKVRCGITSARFLKNQTPLTEPPAAMIAIQRGM